MIKLTLEPMVNGEHGYLGFADGAIAGSLWQGTDEKGDKVVLVVSGVFVQHDNRQPGRYSANPHHMTETADFSDFKAH